MNFPVSARFVPFNTVGGQFRAVPIKERRTDGRRRHAVEVDVPRREPDLLDRVVSAYVASEIFGMPGAGSLL